VASSTVWTVGDADARKPDDPRLAELVGDLSIRDDQSRFEEALRELAAWAAEHIRTPR
jgi:hypothetical protein